MHTMYFGAIIFKGVWKLPRKALLSSKNNFTLHPFLLNLCVTRTDLDLIQTEKSFYSTSNIWAHLVMSKEQFDSVVYGR